MLYDVARKLLESALAIHEQVSGAQSEEYGLGLLKIGDLEKKRNRASEAQAFYKKAIGVLGDRKETASPLMYLGVLSLHSDPVTAADDFRRAQALDASLCGPAQMWTGLASERAGKTEEAEAMYRSALATEDPSSQDHANTTLLLARFLASQNRPDEAKALGNPLPSLPEPPASPNAVRVQDGAIAPKVLEKALLPYPVEAKAAGYSGTVQVRLDVGTDGAAHNLYVSKRAGFGLDESAVAAVSQWRFEPGTKDGAPVNVRATIEVNFTLAK